MEPTPPSMRVERTADPLEEQAEASTDLSRRHQKDQQSAIHQRGCSRWRPDWRLNKIGRDRRVGSVGEKNSDAGSGRENDFFTGTAQCLYTWRRLAAGGVGVGIAGSAASR